jgi:hypothetical protein
MLSQTAGQRLTPHAVYRPVWLPYEADENKTLAEATAEDRHIRTLCACGRVAELDATAWLERGLWFKPLVEFSGNLRCPCGSRRARFEIWPGPHGQSGLPLRFAASLYD